MGYQINVNGRSHDIDEEADTPLLLVLRNELGLVAAKFGCGAGMCGACMVWVDGHPTPSCDLPLEYAVGREIQTLEGLGSPDEPHPLQTAFLDHQAGQCGYCLAGILMTSAAHLRDNADADRESIVQALDRNLCRCGTHQRIVEAVVEAAGSTP